jgi:hypothetical protein
LYSCRWRARKTWQCLWMKPVKLLIRSSGASACLFHTKCLLLAKDFKMSSLHSLESQRSQVFALWSAGWSGAKIAEHLFSIHLENSIKKTAIYGWIERFKDGQSTVDDQPRSGRPCTSGGETSCQRVMALLDSDARLTVREMSDRLDISKSTVHRIVTTDLDLSKISSCTKCLALCLLRPSTACVQGGRSVYSWMGTTWRSRRLSSMIRLEFWLANATMIN